MSGMKRLGIVRKIDELGRVVIPMELRREFNIQERTPIEISVVEEGILLKVVDNEAVLFSTMASIHTKLADDQNILGEEKTKKVLECLTNIQNIINEETP